MVLYLFFHVTRLPSGLVEKSLPISVPIAALSSASTRPTTLRESTEKRAGYVIIISGVISESRSRGQYIPYEGCPSSCTIYIDAFTLPQDYLLDPRAALPRHSER